MSRRRRTAEATALSAFVVLLSIATLVAGFGGLFELGDGFDSPGSGDILGSGAQPGCDWADLFDADPTPDEIDAAVDACGGIGAAFVADGLATGGSVDDTTFVKGSAKNDSPVAAWRWDTGNVPSKDDLSNFYLYSALNEADELILYAGIERLAPNGDSHIDFQLTQVPIELDKDAPCGVDQSAGPGDGAPCEFVGDKSEGDLLVTVDFQKGGDLATVEIRTWDGFQWVLTESLGGEGCNADDSVCAFNNDQAIDGGPWPNYDSKGNEILTLPPNAFTEVGVNTTRLLGSTPCFVNVLAKSRSSASFTSSLKDFTLASFEVCSFTIAKSSSPQNADPTRSKIGDDHVFLYEIENTGGATLYLVSVIDSFFGDITDDARNAALKGIDGGGCDPLFPAAVCSFEKTGAIPDDADDPFETSVDATYGSQEQAAIDEAGIDTIVTVSASDDFPLEIFQPSVDVGKTGDTLSTPGNVVHYTITVTNTSSDDSPPLVNASIVDSVLGDLLDPQNPYVVSSTCGDMLEVGASCTIEAERMVLDEDPNPLPNTVDVLYNPENFPNEITDSDTHSVDLVYPDADFTVTAFPDAAFRGDTIIYTYLIENTGDVPLLRVSVTDTLLGDITHLFPERIEPGAPPVEIMIQYTIPPDAPDPLVNEVTAVYTVEGLPDNDIIRSASFSVDILIPCAKSPGFWKGGSGVPKWDDILTDYIAQNAGFETDTVFPWLDPSLAGSSYLDVLNLSALGDISRQLSFKYIAARLNEATFGVPSDTGLLLDQIDLYFMLHPVGSEPQGTAYDEGQALLNDLNAYFTAVGEANCPPDDQF